MTDEDIDRALRIAFDLGKHGASRYKDLDSADLWEAIKAERKNAADWGRHCEYLGSMISDRVADMEALLTDKLSKPDPPSPLVGDD